MITAYALALVLVLFGAGLLLAALVASPRDPLLRDEKPYGCSCCAGSWTRLADFYAHRCERGAHVPR